LRLAWRLRRCRPRVLQQGVIVRDNDETRLRLIEAQEADANDASAPAPTSPIVDALIPSAIDSAARPLNEEDIRLRAYEIYCSRGDVEGDAVSDWLAAENEIRFARALRGDRDNTPSS
jgi:hypothetical protein